MGHETLAEHVRRQGIRMILAAPRSASRVRNNSSAAIHTRAILKGPDQDKIPGSYR